MPGWCAKLAVSAYELPFLPGSYADTGFFAYELDVMGISVEVE